MGSAGCRRTKSLKGVLRKEDAVRRQRVSRWDLRWVFQCLGYDCKQEIFLQAGALKTHTGKCRSCCQKGLPFEASYNELQNRKLRHGNTITLTYEQYYSLCSFTECHYCESSLSREPFSKINGVDLNSGRTSMLDRKDNNLGYSIENCVPCCWKCNVSKSDRYSYEEWYTMTRCFRERGSCEV